MTVEKGSERASPARGGRTRKGIPEHIAAQGSVKARADRDEEERSQGLFKVANIVLRLREP